MDKMLSKASIEELEAEITRRKYKKPTLNIDIDWRTVIDYAQLILDQVELEHSLTKDYESVLSAYVMEALYGQDIWKWYNQKLNPLVTTCLSKNCMNDSQPRDNYCSICRKKLNAET